MLGEFYTASTGRFGDFFPLAVRLSVPQQYPKKKPRTKAWPTLFPQYSIGSEYVKPHLIKKRK